MGRKMLCLAGIWAMCATSAFAQGAEFHSYHDSAGEVVRLSSQGTEPFLFLGKKLEPDHPRAEEYANSLKRFPDVRSCLLKAERNKPQPDLTQFDWDTLDTTNDAEVCLFRVASSYSDLKAMENWVESQGFDINSHAVPQKNKWLLEGHIPLNNHWPKVSSNIIIKIWIKLISYSQYISISYKDNKVFHASAGYNTL